MRLVQKRNLDVWIEVVEKIDADYEGSRKVF